MSSSTATAMSTACADCARRSAVLVQLGCSLDWLSLEPERLWEALKLSTEELIAGLGGSRRQELSELALTAREAPAKSSREAPAQSSDGVRRICRHSDLYPGRLRATRLAPHELHVTNGARALSALLERPLVAIAGSNECTDHGLELARVLGEDLSVCGAAVIAPLACGIAYGALAGALRGGERAGGVVAGDVVAGDVVAAGVVAGDVERCSPRRCLPVHRGLQSSGCLLSELPCGSKPRRWTQLACIRTLVLMADAVIVVEADEHPRELACAQLALMLGKKLGAVPGRVTSRRSRGTHRLIRQGAELIRDAHDALGLLYGCPPEALDEPLGAAHAPLGATRAPLEPCLEATLAQIGEGQDTAAKLGARRGEIGSVLLELAELELRGLVVRGDGGRYLTCAVAPCG